MSNGVVNIKEPIVSAVISFLIPGTGQAYNGQVKKGIVVLIGYIALWFAVYAIYFAGGFGLAFLTAGIDRLRFYAASQCCSCRCWSTSGLLTMRIRLQSASIPAKSSGTGSREPFGLHIFRASGAFPDNRILTDIFLILNRFNLHQSEGEFPE